MTTDAFTTAARAEAMNRWPVVETWSTPLKQGFFGKRSEFVAGAEWARDHLAQQSFTDAELDAAHTAFVAHSGPATEFNEFHERCCLECGYAISWPGRKSYDGGKRAKRHAAEAALTAAREAAAGAALAEGGETA